MTISTLSTIAKEGDFSELNQASELLYNNISQLINFSESIELIMRFLFEMESKSIHADQLHALLKPHIAQFEAALSNIGALV